MTVAAHAPLCLVGHGHAFFANTYIGACNRMAFSLSEQEVLGRYKGDAVNAHFGNKDCTLQMRMIDNRYANWSYWLGKKAKGQNSMTEPPAQDATATMTFANLCPLALVASGTASTLPNTTVGNVEVYASDYSTIWSVTTNYTIGTAAGTITPVGADLAGKTVNVGYTFVDSTAKIFKVGGGQGPLRGTLRVVFINDADGKLFQYESTTAVIGGDALLAIEAAAENAPVDTSWRILADLTNPTYKYGRFGISSAASKQLQ